MNELRTFIIGIVLAAGVIAIPAAVSIGWRLGDDFYSYEVEDRLFDAFGWGCQFCRQAPVEAVWQAQPQPEALIDERGEIL